MCLLGDKRRETGDISVFYTVALKCSPPTMSDLIEMPRSGVCTEEAEAGLL